MMYFTRYFHYLRNPNPQNDHYPQFHYTRIKSPPFIHLPICAEMTGGGRSLKRKYCIKWTFPWCGSCAELHWSALSGNSTSTLFALQLLQWNMKLLTLFINWTNWGVWMHYTMRIKADKKFIPGQCALCELRSYNGSAGLAAASSLWKYDERALDISQWWQCWMKFTTISIN